MNCYQICYRNSNFITVSRDMRYIWVSISYFDQILWKRECQTRQVFHFAGIKFRGFVVLKHFAGKKFPKNDQKSQHLIPFEVYL